MPCPLGARDLQRRMLAVLAEMALAERETLRERIMSGPDNARRRGRKLGRPAGTVMAPDQLLDRHSAVVRLLKAGKSLRDVAARTGKGLTTVQRIRAAMADPRDGCRQVPSFFGLGK